jgi:transposase
LDLSELPKRPALERLPRRWVAERAFAWISHDRGMGRVHERLCGTGEAFVYAAMSRLMGQAWLAPDAFQKGS